MQACQATMSLWPNSLFIEGGVVRAARGNSQGFNVPLCLQIQFQRGPQMQALSTASLPFIQQHGHTP